LNPVFLPSLHIEKEECLVIKPEKMGIIWQPGKSGLCCPGEGKVEHAMPINRHVGRCSWLL
jgi:hypothetical protein